MKKMILFLMMCVSINTVSQTLIKPNSEMKSCIGCFYNKKTSINSIFMNVDVNNDYYLSIESKAFTWGDYIYPCDFDNYKINHIIKTGKRLFIKLNNDSVITLTCMSYYFSYGSRKLEVCGNGVDWGCTTKISSMFKLSDNDMNALKTHDIVKLRLEFDNEYFDVEHNDKSCEIKDCANVKDIFDYLNKRYIDYIESVKTAKTIADKQEKMKSNPLYNF